MRAVVVVNLPEVVEALLLLEEVEGGGLGRFLLQGQMKTFMAGVLLRMSGSDALEADTEAQPPHGELGQAEQGTGRSEGGTVIGTDRCGQAEVFERSFEDGEGEVRLGGLKTFAGEQIARAIVTDGERVTVLMVTEHELALVVGAPQAVGRIGAEQGCALRLAPCALPALDQSVAIEGSVDGADRRRRDHGIQVNKLVADLRRSPGGMLLFDPQDRALDLERKPVGLAVGRTAAIVEPMQATFSVALEDLVAGHPGDAELPTQRCHSLAFEEARDELQSLIHRFTLFPRHRGAPPNAEMCKPSDRYSPSAICR